MTAATVSMLAAAVEVDGDDRRTTPASEDEHFMTLALALAAKGINTTHPNPRVGAVVVAGGEVVGAGWHRTAGSAHAETEALAAAGARAHGATLYVNLEPCQHHGRTPPCAEAVAAAGIRRVVAAMRDPNPQAGGGIAALRRAGVEVEVGVGAAAAERLNRGFCMRLRAARPWVTLKMAASVDGATATASGESQWITSPAARQDAHQLRAASAAILTGIGTVLRDDPRMTVRLDDGKDAGGGDDATPPNPAAVLSIDATAAANTATNATIGTTATDPTTDPIAATNPTTASASRPSFRQDAGIQAGRMPPPPNRHPHETYATTATAAPPTRQPLRVILDTHLSLPPTAQILAPPGRALVITAADTAIDTDPPPLPATAEVIPCRQRDGRIDLHAVMTELARREINDLLLEAGPRLSAAMLAEDLVDEIVLYLAPDVLGGGARAMFDLPPLAALAERRTFEFSEVRRVGRDLRLTLTPAR